MGTPVGRILNVFAGDMMELDITLPNIFNWWSLTIPVLFTALIPAVIVVPAIIPLVLIMLIFCIVVYRSYGDVNIEISRLYMMSIGCPFQLLQLLTGFRHHPCIQSRRRISGKF